MTLFLIYLGCIFWTLVVAQIPQKLPTIKDEVFSFPQNGMSPPRIPLEYVRGVVSNKGILDLRTKVYLLTILH